MKNIFVIGYLVLTVEGLVNRNPPNDTFIFGVHAKPDRITYPNELDTSTTNRTEKLLDLLCADFDEKVNNTLVAANIDGGNRSCYEIGTVGPCSQNMKFYAIPGPRDLGMCDCDQEILGIAYSSETGFCHFLYHQEICTEGYWLELKSGGPMCSLNPCFSQAWNKNATDNQVFYNGKCVKLHSLCKTDSYEGYVNFDGSNSLRCLPSDTNYSITRTIPKLKCSEGTRWSQLTNTCKKTIIFNLN